jgi:hypothetical protein
VSLEHKAFLAIVESLPEAILYFDARGILMLGNELGKMFLVLHRNSRYAFQIVAGVRIPSGFLKPYVEPVFTGRQVNLSKEVFVTWMDGQHIYRINVERLIGELEKTEGYFVILRDITFRKRMPS